MEKISQFYCTFDNRYEGFLFIIFEISFQLHYLRLPKDISKDHVLLMDATVASGAAGRLTQP